MDFGLLDAFQGRNRGFGLDRGMSGGSYFGGSGWDTPEGMAGPGLQGQLAETANRAYNSGESRDQTKRRMLSTLALAHFGGR